MHSHWRRTRGRALGRDGGGAHRRARDAHVAVRLLSRAATWWRCLRRPGVGVLLVVLAAPDRRPSSCRRRRSSTRRCARSTGARARRRRPAVGRRRGDAALPAVLAGVVGAGDDLVAEAEAGRTPTGRPSGWRRSCEKYGVYESAHPGFHSAYRRSTSVRSHLVRATRRLLKLLRRRLSASPPARRRCFMTRPADAASSRPRSAVVRRVSAAGGFGLARRVNLSSSTEFRMTLRLDSRRSASERPSALFVRTAPSPPSVAPSMSFHLGKLGT